MPEVKPEDLEPEGLDAEVDAMYDASSSEGLACRTCGALVAPGGQYRRIHWEWHEASNGA